MNNSVMMRNFNIHSLEHTMLPIFPSSHSLRAHYHLKYAAFISYGYLRCKILQDTSLYKVWELSAPKEPKLTASLYVLTDGYLYK
jgi:hypothetical protein